MGFQKFHLSFDKGVDTKTDPQLVEPPYLLTLYNAVLTKVGTWTKRNGYSQLGTSILGGGTISSGQTLATFDKELLLFTNGTGYSYISAAQSWSSKGSLTPVALTEDTIIRNNYAQSNPDCDSISGTTVYAWEDGRGGIYARVIDETTGALYIADTQLSATGKRPKVVALNGVICVLYAEGTNLRFTSVTLPSPTAFSTAVTVDSTMNATPVLDAVAYGTTAILAAWNDGSNTTRLAYVTNAGILGSPVTGYPNELTIATSCNQAVCVVYDSTNLAVWVGMASATNFTAAAYTTAFATTVAPVLIDNSTNVNGIIGVVASTTMTWTYQILAAATYNYLLEQNTLTLAGAVGTKAVYLRSVGLGSKPFTYGGSTYAWAAFQSTLQATPFLLRLDASAPTIMAKGVSGQGGGLYTSGVLPRCYSPATGTYTCAATTRTQFVNTITVNNTTGNAGTTVPSSGVPTAITTYFLTGVDRLDVTFANPNQYQALQLGENLHLTGGFLTQYDGQGFVEHNFHLYPENIVATPSTSGGSMADGTYQFIVVWYWQDAKGLLHRSAPSTPVQAIISGGGGAGSVALTIPTLRLTAKQGTRAKVIAAVFRASTTAQTYCRVGNGAADPVTAPVYNDTTADTISFSSTVADATIQANEPLYTTGGIVANSAPPAASLIAHSLNRIFVAGICNQPNTIWHSKANVVGGPVEMSALLTVQIPATGGAITALAVMDGTVFAFKRDSIYAFFGQGPDSTGSTAVNQFSMPTLISTDVGCIVPQSLVLTRDGLMFMSPKGIYLLSRTLAAEYVGWQVEALNTNTVSSATMISGTNQVRFTYSNGNRAVYDYIFKQWSIDTNSTAVDALNWNGTFTYLTSAGAVYTETPGVYLDGTQPIQTFLETAWIPFSGLQGFNKIIEGHFLGTFYAPHKMEVAIAYNYQPFNSEVKEWNPNTVLSGGSAYGVDTYGATTYGGDINTVNQFRFKPAIRKCESVKFQFYDQGGSGKGFSVSGLDLTWTPLEKNFPAGSSQTI